MKIRLRFANILPKWNVLAPPSIGQELEQNSHFAFALSERPRCPLKLLRKLPIHSLSLVEK